MHRVGWQAQHRLGRFGVGVPCDPGFKVGLRYRAACLGCPRRNVTPQPRGTAWWTQGPQKLINALLVTV